MKNLSSKLSLYKCKYKDKCAYKLALQEKNLNRFNSRLKTLCVKSVVFKVRTFHCEYVQDFLGRIKYSKNSYLHLNSLKSFVIAMMAESIVTTYTMTNILQEKRQDKRQGFANKFGPWNGHV